MADNTSFEQAYEECRREAIRDGALKPQGVIESLAANANASLNGQRFEDTALAQHRLEEWTRERMRRKGFSV